MIRKDTEACAYWDKGAKLGGLGPKRVTRPVAGLSEPASRYQTGAGSKNRLGGRGVCRGDY